MQMQRIVRAALLAGATTVSVLAVDQLLALRRQHRARSRKSAVKAAVQDWENEGGATLM
jgi:hypothetical protein